MQATSLEAYEEVVKTLGKRQYAVYTTIKHNSTSLTNSEIADALGWSINRVTPRVFELRKQGLVCEDRRRYCDITGRTVIAWRSKGPEKDRQMEMKL